MISCKELKGKGYSINKFWKWHISWEEMKITMHMISKKELTQLVKNKQFLIGKYGRWQRMVEEKKKRKRPCIFAGERISSVTSM
jgi:hypothetical protein